MSIVPQFRCFLYENSKKTCSHNENRTIFDVFLRRNSGLLYFLRLKCHLTSVAAAAVASAPQTVLPDGITNNTNRKCARKYLNFSEYLQYFRIKCKNEAGKCFKKCQLNIFSRFSFSDVYLNFLLCQILGRTLTFKSSCLYSATIIHRMCIGCI